MYLKKRSNYLFSMAIAILFLSCGKENPVDKLLPDVNVDLTIRPASIQYTFSDENGNGNLINAGGWLYVDGGYRGIIIFNTGLPDFTYRAFERTAPYGFPNDSDCRVEMDESGWFAIDPCSKTKYSLFDDGLPDDQGPGSLPLKQYNTSFDGTNLHVYD